MQVIQILVLLGFPTLFATVAWIVKHMVKFNSDITIMKSALQGMMRAQLIKDGKQYVKDGTITELELYDWKGRYEAYHKLGVNGVLDALNEEIISIAIHN